MTVKEELTRKVTNRLFTKYVRQYQTSAPWAWGVLRDAAEGASIAEIKQLTDATLNTQIIKDHLRELANEEAQAKLSDDSLDLVELDRIFN